MKILLDTNIVLDVLLNRTDYISNSLGAITKAIKNGDRIYLSSSAATDVYYVVRKQTGSKEQALDSIKKLARILNFAPVDEECILLATFSKINDYEDAVNDAVASHIKANYIITRNIDDYKESKNRILTPLEFINI